MSIAVSAVVRPSRLLLALTAAMCLLVFGIGALVVAAQPGEPGQFARLFLAAFCMMLAAVAALRAAALTKTHHIDISGHGQIRLAEYKGTTAQAKRASEGEGSFVRLAPGTTLWPGMLLLHLKADGQRRIVLPVLPDSVGADQFRSLALACRWIAAHNHSTNQTPLEEKSHSD